MNIWQRLYWGPLFGLRGLVLHRYWAIKPPSVVLWGGRPRIDYQFGGVRDKARTRRLLLLRKMRRDMHNARFSIGVAMIPAIKAAVEAMNRFGTSMRDLQEALARTH